MAGVEDYSLIYVLVFFYIGIKLWQRIGGWPEGYYILAGTDYFQAYVIQANTKVRRYLIKMSKVKTHSAAMFTIGKGKDAADFLMPTTDNEKFANPHNAPAGLYNHNDSRPIPVKNRSDQMVDPVVVHTAFNNDALEKLNTPEAQRKALKQQTTILVLLLFVTFMAAMVSAYYAYNTACAAHSPVCFQVNHG